MRFGTHLLSLNTTLSYHPSIFFFFFLFLFFHLDLLFLLTDLLHVNLKGILAFGWSDLGLSSLHFKGILYRFCTFGPSRGYLIMNLTHKHQKFIYRFIIQLLCFKFLQKWLYPALYQVELHCTHLNRQILLTFSEKGCLWNTTHALEQASDTIHYSWAYGWRQGFVSYAWRRFWYFPGNIVRYANIHARNIVCSRN